MDKLKTAESIAPDDFILAINRSLAGSNLYGLKPTNPDDLRLYSPDYELTATKENPSTHLS